MITQHYPMLLVILPLFSAFLVLIFGRFFKSLASSLTSFSLMGLVYFSVMTLLSVMNVGKLTYFSGNWVPPIGIELVVDYLNAPVLVLIAIVSLLVSVYSRRFIGQEIPGHGAYFYSLYLLLVSGLMGMTATGDAFNLYVLIEVAALTSYALLAFGSNRSAYSVFNYLILGTIGACLYLLGVGFLLIKAGTLNMGDLHYLLLYMMDSNAILVAFGFIIMGMWVKMAFFPMHGWLPNVYTYAPISSVCLIAPLMTKVAVYVMVRVMYTLFSVEYVFSVLQVQHVVVGMAVLAIVVGAFYALMQKDLRKMLCYLVVSEIGYMVGGAWLGNVNGLSGTIYHLLADGLMTLVLFMVVGCIMYREKEVHIDRLSALFSKMPITMTVFLVAAFSMIGIPPLAGFFSKWYLISGAIESGQWVFVTALLLSSLINAILFFRIIERCFFASTHQDDSPQQSEGDLLDHGPALVVKGGALAFELPVSMLFSLVVGTVLIVLLGLFNQFVFSYLIFPFMPEGFF